MRERGRERCAKNALELRCGTFIIVVGLFWHTHSLFRHLCDKRFVHVCRTCVKTDSTCRKRLHIHQKRPTTITNAPHLSSRAFAQMCRTCVNRDYTCQKRLHIHQKNIYIKRDQQRLQMHHTSAPAHLFTCVARVSTETTRAKRDYICIKRTYTSKETNNNYKCAAPQLKHICSRVSHVCQNRLHVSKEITYTSKETYNDYKCAAPQLPRICSNVSHMCQQRLHVSKETTYTSKETYNGSKARLVGSLNGNDYGVASISRLLKMIGLCCRI